MCGITGFNWEDRQLIKKMTKEISHRGPDDRGTYTDKNFSLGHTRLSILDLSKKGHQPMFNEDKTIAVIFNGEIYNFKKIREELEKQGHKFESNSDTEVIVHGYEEYGEKIISLLRGMFAFCIWDIKNKTAIIARDHIGIKPLYYYHEKGKFIFASEIKAILLDNTIKREIDQQCLSDYLTLRFSPNQRTMFKNIHKLKNGEYIVYKKSDLQIKPYWKYPNFTKKFAPSTKLVNNLVHESIKKRLMADVPVGVFLSGGLDSSTMVAHLSKIKDNIKTFSIGFDDPTDEVKYAQIIADKFNTDHTEIISSKNILTNLPKVVWHLDEPMADPASLPSYVLSEQVSKKVKVVLSGEGGDEVFGGYSDLNLVSQLKFLMKIPNFIRKGMSKTALAASPVFQYPHKQMLQLGSEILSEKTAKQGFKKMFYFPFDQKDKSQLIQGSENLSMSTTFDNYIDKIKDIKTGAFSYYFQEWLPNDLLAKADKLGLGNALEIRVPYLDLDLVNYSHGLDHKYKQDRYLFRKSIKNMLPQTILKKKKQGFTLPLSNWFIKKSFVSNLNPHFQDLAKRNLFKQQAYNKIINNPTKFRNDHRMWVLLNFELWCKLYLDKINHKNISI